MPLQVEVYLEKYGTLSEEWCVVVGPEKSAACEFREGSKCKRRVKSWNGERRLRCYGEKKKLTH